MPNVCVVGSVPFYYYAEERGIEVELAVEEGISHKAEEFWGHGSEIYKED